MKNHIGFILGSGLATLLLVSASANAGGSVLQPNASLCVILDLKIEQVSATAGIARASLSSRCPSLVFTGTVAIVHDGVTVGEAQLRNAASAVVEAPIDLLAGGEVCARADGRAGLGGGGVIVRRPGDVALQSCSLLGALDQD